MKLLKRQVSRKAIRLRLNSSRLILRQVSTNFHVAFWLEKPEGYVEPQRRPRGDRRPRRDGERRFDERRPRRENNEFENND